MFDELEKISERPEPFQIIEKTRIRTVYNWLQFFSRDSLQQELEDNGFQVEAFYSDVARRQSILSGVPGYGSRCPQAVMGWVQMTEIKKGRNNG